MSDIKSSSFPVREVAASISGLLIGLWLGWRLFQGIDAYQLINQLGGFGFITAYIAVGFLIFLLAGRVIRPVIKRSLIARLILLFAGSALIGAGLAVLLP